MKPGLSKAMLTWCIIFATIDVTIAYLILH